MTAARIHDLYLFQDVLGFPLALNVMNRHPDAAVRYVNSDAEIRPRPGADAEAWRRGALVLRTSPTQPLVPAGDLERHSGIGSVLELGTGGGPGQPATLYVNVPEVLQALSGHKPEGVLRLGRGLDLLRWCRLTGLTGDLLAAVQGTGVEVEGWTRGGDPGPLLKHKVPLRLTLVLAAAPQDVLDALEPGEPDLEDRLRAGQTLRKAGFRVVLSLEPVRCTPGYRRAYAELAFQAVRELGTAEQLRLAAPGFPAGTAPDARMGEPPGGWVVEGNRLCYPPEERLALYREVARTLNRPSTTSSLRPVGGWGKLKILDRKDLVEQALRP